MKKNSIAEMAQCLKIHTIPVQIKRTRRGYRAFMPAKITKDGGVGECSEVDITPGSYNRKIDLKLAISQRFEAEVFSKSDTMYIRPRYALKSPRWFGRFGALPELTRYARRAGLL